MSDHDRRRLERAAREGDAVALLMAERATERTAGRVRGPAEALDVALLHAARQGMRGDPVMRRQVYMTGAASGMVSESRDDGHDDRLDREREWARRGRSLWGGMFVVLVIGRYQDAHPEAREIQERIGGGASVRPACTPSDVLGYRPEATRYVLLSSVKPTSVFYEVYREAVRLGIRPWGEDGA